MCLSWHTSSDQPCSECTVWCRHEAYDARADVWSFGVLLVECLTQQKPYAATYMAPVQIAIQVGCWRHVQGLVGGPLVEKELVPPTPHCSSPCYVAGPPAVSLFLCWSQRASP